jgi:hypothetical protein
LQLGQLYLIGGAATALLASLATIVFWRLGCAAAGTGGGAAGTCKRWPQDGQGFFVPASIAGASRAALQRGQLYLMGGAVSPSKVLAKPAGADISGGAGASGSPTDFPAKNGDWQLGQTCRLPMSPSGIENLY